MRRLSRIRCIHALLPPHAGATVLLPRAEVAEARHIFHAMLMPRRLHAAAAAMPLI